MWLHQREFTASLSEPAPAAAAPAEASAAPEEAPAKAAGRTLEPIFVEAELPALVELGEDARHCIEPCAPVVIHRTACKRPSRSSLCSVGKESFTEAAAILGEDKGRAKLMTWFKDRGCTVPQRQAAVNAISKAIKQQAEEKKEKKKGAEKPNDAISSNADGTTYLMCRGKLPISTIPNLRDVSWTHASLRAGALIRCGCVDFCSPRDAKMLADDMGVRSRIDLRLPPEIASGGSSSWFLDLKREARPCANALAQLSQVALHHVPFDGMLGDETSSITTLRCAAWHHPMRYHPRSQHHVCHAHGATSPWCFAHTRWIESSRHTVAHGTVALSPSRTACRSTGAGLEALAELNLEIEPPKLKFTATTGLGTEANETMARFYKTSTYGSELTAAAKSLLEHYLRCAPARN